MRVIFWGSPDFAVATLDALLESAHDVVAVVTQPPRPKGRGRGVEPTAVERRAREVGIPVLAPSRPRGEAFLGELRALAPDVFVVAAYGAILPPEALALPPHGAINVHASLLPEYRGASPATRAILDGRAETGVTIVRMDEGLDTGPILLRASTPISPDETAGTLTTRLATLGAGLLVAALDRLALGSLPKTPQDDVAASYASKVTVEEARLDWTRAVAELERAARAFDPQPGAWTTWRGERLKVFRLEPTPEARGEGGIAVPASAEGVSAAAPPGTIVAVDPAPVVRAGDGLARLVEVQPAGGRRMAGEAWARGRDVEAGERLGA
jgi:methionyl-tRNA formyltransferase